VRAIILIEHDAKTLAHRYGLKIPDGVLISALAPQAPPFPPPWIVKAQVTAGGRGKSGGIRKVTDRDDLADTMASIANLKIAGFPVHDVRIEQAIDAAQEVYLGLVMDAASGKVAVMASEHGGVDVEDQGGAMIRRDADLDDDALTAALKEVAQSLPDRLHGIVAEAGAILIALLLDLEATMVEINPLFVLPDGSWIAGDLRLDLDLNALDRQPDLARLIDMRPDTYVDAAFKARHGYDLVVTDPNGEIGLVATGAGLSMQLIDEMTRLGLKPYNFCDIRSGMMRGDPTRLIENLQALEAAPNLRCVLINIFAGITELGEFAELLLRALEAGPRLDVPFVVRLVGNGQDRADEILGASGRTDLLLERDLDRALDRCREVCHD